MNSRTHISSFAVACMIVVGLALAGGNNAAAGAHGEWVASDDGCAYLWNAYLNGYEASMCFLAGGEISYYVASNGAWVWAGNFIPQGNGVYLVLAPGSNGWITACAPGYEANCSSGGGGYTDGGLTGNATVDQVLIDSYIRRGYIAIYGGYVNCDYTYEC